MTTRKKPAPINPATLGERIIADILETGDLLGVRRGAGPQDRIPGGSAFLLVALRPDTFAALCQHGEEIADLEETDPPAVVTRGAMLGQCEDDEDDDPGEDNGDGGEQERASPSEQDYAILAVARARYRAKHPARRFRTTDPTTGRLVEFVPIGRSW